MNKPYQIRLTPEQTFTHLTTITSGLLAAGELIENIDVTAAGVLRQLMMYVEYDVDEGSPDRYILPDDTSEPRGDNPTSKRVLDNLIERLRTGPFVA